MGTINNVITSDFSPPQWCVDAIESFRGQDGQSPAKIAQLTRRLAKSGEVLTQLKDAADVASTGGPASLTTFVPPLLLASHGVLVPKIGVQGRPAGVVDTFGVIPGYQTALSRTEFERAMHSSGFANTLSKGVFAPDDGILFQSRQQLGAQSVPALVIASLLSKKLAAGLTRVVFDVRTMTGGNFGQDSSEAKTNIQLLRDTAALVGIQVHCVVTDGNTPAQPMVGRAEALCGLLALLNHRASPWLERHFATCVSLATLLDRRIGRTQLDRARILRLLDVHLQAQGASGLSAIEHYLEVVKKTHSTSPVIAPIDGRIRWDMQSLRTTVAALQAESPASTGASFPDACGVELLRDSNEYVEAGTPVARVRTQDTASIENATKAVANCLTITSLGSQADERRHR